MGGERDKPAQNLPSPSSSAFAVRQAGGMGHILSWGGQEEVRTIHGRGILSRAKLLCLLLTTCQAQPHSAVRNADRNGGSASGGKRPSRIQLHGGSESLTTSTWVPTPERAGQKLHTNNR